MVWASTLPKVQRAIEALRLVLQLGMAFPLDQPLAEYRFRRILEEKQDLRDLANLQAQMESRRRWLVAFFRPSSGH